MMEYDKGTKLLFTCVPLLALVAVWAVYIVAVLQLSGVAISDQLPKADVPSAILTLPLLVILTVGISGTINSLWGARVVSHHENTE